MDGTWVVVTSRWCSTLLASGFACPPDLGDDTVEVVEDLIVGYPNDAQVEGCEQFIALAVAVHLIGQQMNGPIDLNDYTPLVAIEVCDELADRLLTPKVQVAELISS